MSYLGYSERSELKPKKVWENSNKNSLIEKKVRENSNYPKTVTIFVPKYLPC